MANLGPIPYSSPTMYDPGQRSNDSIAALMMRQGDIQAQSADRSGQIWGNAIGQIGQQLGAGVQMYQGMQDANKLAQVKAAKEAGIYSVLQNADPKDQQGTAKELMKYMSPTDAIATTKGYGLLQTPDKADAVIPQAVTAAKALTLDTIAKHSGPDWHQQHWDTTVAALGPGIQQATGLTLSPQWSPDQEQIVHTFADTARPKPKVHVVGNALVNEDTGQPVYQGEDKDKPIEQQYLDRIKAGDMAGAAALADANHKFKESNKVVVIGGGMGGNAQMAAMTDPKAIATSIENGELPPVVSNYGRGVQGAVASELAKRGFNLAKAATDWNATQKHVSTLNGAQQTRLNQSVNALPDLLDSVEALSNQWKGGRFPILNKANLTAAKGGAYGPDVASIATQLESQIADVNADLATVYMGGNSPTDHGLALASKALNGEWDQKVLQGGINLARQNVKIRQNSIRNTGVSGASAGNPYANGGGEAPAPAAAAPAAPGTAPVASPPRPPKVPANYVWNPSVRHWQAP